MFNILLFLPLSITTLIVKTVLSFLGFVLVPIAISFKAYHIRDSKYFKDGQGNPKKISAWTWKLFWIFGNEEDGLSASAEFPNHPLWFRQLYWYYRNPANNLRFVPLFAPIVDPKKVKFKASFGTDKDNIPYETLAALEDGNDGTKDGKVPFWYFCTMGPYWSFRYEFKVGQTMYRFWASHKLYPSSIYKVPDYQRHGVGFSVQLKRVK